MAKIGNAKFVGKSTIEYRSTVFPFKTKFKEGIAAVYMVTRRFEQEDGTHAHEWLFVGSTPDLRRQFERHEQTFGFNKYKANAICVIREDDEKIRREIHADLWAAYLPLLNE